MQAASPNGVVGAGVAALELVPLHADTAASSEQSAMMVKFTDESIAAIRKAQRSRLPIKMRMDPQGGQIEIGLGENITKFRFVVQQLPGTPADAVVFDRVRGYRATASLQSKVQIQATEKTFAETREKAQKLAEEEKRKAMKDVSRQRRDQRPVTVKRATNPLAIGAQRPSPSSSDFPKNHPSDSSRNNLPKSTNNSQNGSNAAASSAGARLVRAELSRKPLRKRVIHLVVLGKFRNADEVIAQLRKDAISEDGVQEAVKARDIVDEVSETGKETGRLQLKQSFYNEVDARWPGFNSEEKSMVRKILSGNIGSSSNFAPTRKSGMAPPQAPPASHSSNISPEAIPTPPTSSGQQRSIASSSGGSRKTSPKLCPPGTTAPSNKSPPAPVNSSSCSTGAVSNPLDDLLPTSASSGVKRKAHVPPPSVVADKRPRQQSLSPPEDPSSANPATVPPPQKSLQRNERNAQNGGDTSTASSTGSSPLTVPSQPSRDWSKYFGEARSLAEAEKYYNMFIADYPAYMECYKVLASVANEFSGLEKQLNESSKHPREHEKVERTIQTKYSHYQRDTEFLQTRQRHADLRAKLDVLKKRIHAWETNHAKRDAAQAEVDSRGSSLSDNLLVM